MKLILLTTVLLIAGCTPTGFYESETTPKGWRVITTPGNNFSYIVPVVMDDGTRCIVLSSNSSGRGGITCDWGKK